MPYNPPKLILVTTDDSIMEYQKTVLKSKSQKEDMYLYKFIKAEIKLNLEFTMSEEQIVKGLTNSFKEI